MDLDDADPPDPSRPGAWADLPPEPRSRIRDRRGIVTGAAGGGWILACVAVFWFAGVGGWRDGWLLAPLACAAGTGLVVWRCLGPRIVGRGMWTAATVIAGMTVGVRIATTAPPSAPRLAADIDAMHLRYLLWQRTSERHLGHGWCAPTCPEVIAVYRSPNNSDSAALAAALVGLHRLGLVPNVRDAYNHQYGPVIAVRARQFGGTVTIGHQSGRVTLTVDFTARR